VKLQCGQALVETLVATTVMVTLLTAMPAVLAYHDIQRTAQRAARDATWLAGWRVSDVATSSRESFAELAWRHPADGQPIIHSSDGLELFESDNSPPGRAAAMLQFIAAPLGASGSYLGDSFALSQQGLRRARVDVQVPPLRGAPAPFDSLALSLRGEAALLTDAWNAADAAHVASRAGGLVPTRLLQSADAPIRAFKTLLRVVEPAYQKFCPGLIEPDRVPETRLRAGDSRALLRGDAAHACR
jgi:hypothetical protein